MMDEFLKNIRSKIRVGFSYEFYCFSFFFFLLESWNKNYDGMEGATIERRSFTLGTSHDANSTSIMKSLLNVTWTWQTQKVHLL